MSEEQTTSGEQTPTTEKKGRGRARRLVGRVVNDTSKPGRAKKTVKKYHAHDENEEVRARDMVEIKSCRPMSRTKRWVVSRLIERPPEV